MTTNKQIDWELIERDYRAGLLSLREIASQHEITEGAVRKRAKRDGWERDLAAKIRAKAEALVRKEAVRSEVRGADSFTEREIIESNAERIAQVQSGHRKDIGRGRTMVMQLFAEVEAQTGDDGLFERLGELMDKASGGGEAAKAATDRLNDAYRRVISTPGRVSSVKALVESLKTLVGMERTAYGIGDDGRGGGQFEQLLSEISDAIS